MCCWKDIAVWYKEQKHSFSVQSSLCYSANRACGFLPCGRNRTWSDRVVHQEADEKNKTVELRKHSSLAEPIKSCPVIILLCAFVWMRQWEERNLTIVSRQSTREAAPAISNKWNGKCVSPTNHAPAEWWWWKAGWGGGRIREEQKTGLTILTGADGSLRLCESLLCLSLLSPFSLLLAASDLFSFHL